MQTAATCESIERLREANDSLKVVVNSLRQANSLPEGINTAIVAVGAVMAMVGGLWLVHAHLRSRSFEANSLKALGLILFLPTLLMISVLNDRLQSEALAALLGTVAGYVLSQARPRNDLEPRSRDDSAPPSKPEAGV
ncbi:MAG TPA: hypothetical protein VF092_28460 [Longimicrobium sp.]